MTRHREGRSPTAPEDRLFFDGTNYYAYDTEGNRTSRYRNDARGDRLDLTTYEWGDDNQLIAIQEWDRPGHCMQESKIAHEATEMRPDSIGGTANGNFAYDGLNFFHITGSANRLRKIAFVSPHCVLDSTNGAATATLDGLALLAKSGFECQAFCGTRFDAWNEVLAEESLARRRLRYEVRNMRIESHFARMIFSRYNSIAATLFNFASTRGLLYSDAESEAFVAASRLFLEKYQPDVVWTYGGDRLSRSIHETAKQLGIPVLFALHNFRYEDVEPFRMVDRIIVPTEFARRHYRDKLGLVCDFLPLAVDPERVWIADRKPQYVTFVNPDPGKGVHVFARLAEVLSRRRPDIPLLLVEGAARMNALERLGVNLGRLKSVTIWPNTPDAKKFLAVSKLILMPSLMDNAGFVAMEAMTNGIPVVASNRGGLLETIGNAAPVIEIPDRFTPESRDMPTEEEVAPWVETIVRLWDDEAEYDRWSRAARECAHAWHPDRLAPVYRDFFAQLAVATPPLVKR